jgi:hypothetical protein
MEMNDPTIEAIEDIVVRKQQRSEEENQVAHDNNAKAEAEEKARMEELAKKMTSGETITNENLEEIFKNHTAGADDDSVDDEKK